MSVENPTPSEAAAKREGYIQGRSDESYVQSVARDRALVADRVQVRESSGTGVIFGLVVAGLALAIGGLFYVANMDRGGSTPVVLPEVDSDITEVELPDVQVDVPDVQVDVPEVSDLDVNVTDEAPAEPATE